MKAVGDYIIVEEVRVEGKWSVVQPWRGILRSDPRHDFNEGVNCVFDPEAQPRVEIEPGLIIIPRSALMGVEY